MVPTEEQEKIIAAARFNNESLKLPAYAGCSKSTSLQMVGKFIKVPTAVWAFNRRIMEDLKPRFAGNFSVRTINGTGHLAWMRANNQVNKWTLDDKKLGKLVSQTIKDRKLDLSSEQWQALREMVKWAMMEGLVPKGQGFGLLVDDADGWKVVADRLGLDNEDFQMLLESAQEILSKSIELARSGTISFDEQIYCSAMLGGNFPKYPLIMADEFQDFSMMNIVMLRKSLRPDGRLIIVGDERQAIYSWRGAHGDALSEGQKLRPDWLTLPLTLTFRCPKTVVARQQRHAPGFRAHESNRNGKIVSLRSFELDEGWAWADVEKLRGAGQSLAVLCRNNAPLLKLAFKLLRQRIGVQILGRDLSSGLVALAKKLAGNNHEMSAVEFAIKLKDWQEHEAALALANGQEEKVDSIEDRAESLRAVLDDAEVRDVKQLCRMIEMIFNSTDNRVTLSSIHKAKGLEWDVVLHLDPWRIPSKFAKQEGGVALQQEANLLYVAETRTKETLVEADLDGFGRGD